ncbi:hypothetical protein GCM10023170_017230 [Phytohabitans houttuyneae]|uniref:Thymidylate synthase/dCMP hydroxymethylase domain-containing protein n=1 Tax=Phytohabitans houttuyneae TaxID=1076126 RepID=A0A6V8KZ93_9ACTN|nr:hypothetical protein Phou_100250 [Phytohabitans houttuyneae]
MNGVTDPLSVGSSFRRAPRPFREIQAYSFTLDHPEQVLFASAVRPLSLPYALANILWTVTGDDTVAGIRFWNDRAAAFTDDGVRVRSALGPRLFGAAQQFAVTLQRLRADRATRRALVLMVESKDLTTPTRDVPCMMGLQLLLRDDRLDAVATMRSQSALMVMPYDVALLTTIQRLLAAELGIAPGRYMHFAASMHIYEDELDVATSVAEEDLTPKVLPHPGSLQELQSIGAVKNEIERESVEELIRRSKQIGGRVHDEDTLGGMAESVLLGHALLKCGRVGDALVAWGRAGDLGRLCAMRVDLKERDAAHKISEPEDDRRGPTG